MAFTAANPSLEYYMNVQLLALLSGIAFGIWPMLANRSGMQGNPLSLCLLGVALLLNAPFALKQGVNLPSAQGTTLMVAEGLLMGTGMLFFNGMLAKVSKTQVASMFILMMVVQIAVPAIWQLISGNASAKQLAGIAAAVAAAILLG